VRHPGAVSAALPLSGWLPPLLWPSARSAGGPPILAFHGTDDDMVPLERARAGANRLMDLGYDVKLREFVGVGHAIPPPIRSELFAALAATCTRQSAAGAH
jgi:predicted esterase